MTDNRDRKSAEMRSKWSGLGLFIIAFIFLALGSWLLSITDPVESNYALTAKEMVLSGNWMSPQIYGIYWYDKPIMVYWLLSLSYTVFGFTDFGSRLPAIFCGALSAPLLTYYVKRITGKRAASTWAAVMLATSLEFWLISHAIITDSILLLFTIPTLLSAYIGLYEGNKKHMMIAYGAAGLSCLTKGPVGLALPGLFLLLWCGWMKKSIYWKRLFPWRGILTFIIVCFPWYVGMYLIHGSDFLYEFLGIHNILRATSSEHPADNVWYYYIALFPLSLLPWFGLSLYGIKKEWSEKSPFCKFLLVWLAGTLIFYTLMATKYVTYTYISVVPAILFAALHVTDIAEGKRAACLALAVPFLFMASALGIGTIKLPDVEWAAFYCIIAYSFYMVILRWKSSKKKLLLITASATAGLYLCLVFQAFPAYMMTRSSALLADTFHNLPGAHYFFRSYAASFTYYTGETATKLTPDIPGGEKRDARWNAKYVMPTVSEKEWLTKLPAEDIYLFVSPSNEKFFSRWDRKSDFTKETSSPSGTIYKMKDRHDH